MFLDWMMRLFNGTQSLPGRLGASRGECRAAASLLAVSTSLLALLWGAVPSASQELMPELWGTDGNVVATARLGNTLYIAGAFNAVGPVTGGGVPVERETGESISSFPRVAGIVRAVISDHEGGWYIGGLFTAVGRVRCVNLAHILSDGRVADWSPNPDGEVQALALTGEMLYAGGLFRRIGGEPRDYVAAVDTQTGAVTGFDPQPDEPVRVLLFDSGRLYVGGDFSSIGGHTRHSVAELDPSTGLVTPWNPDVSFYGNPARVHSLAAQGDTIYIGGSFSNVGLSQRGNLTAVHALTGLPTEWNPIVTGPDDSYYGAPYVATLVVRGEAILVGGRFTGIGNQIRGGLAEVNRLSGLVTPWNPDPGPWFGNVGGDVYALVVKESTVYVGGSFYTLGGQPRNYIGEVDLATGLATDWDPKANDFGVMALAMNENTVYAGGTFTGMGHQWQLRRGLAALDATTGVLKDWNPDPNGLITYALAVAHGEVYVGGHFSMVGGQERLGLAALDTLTGLATGWNPTASNVVSTLTVARDTLYAGGQFTTIGGIPRNHLASFDLTTGELTDWDPNPSSSVYDIEVNDGIAYVCGFFDFVGGVPRRHIAAVDATTGALTDWNPDPDRSVYSLTVRGETVFVVGPFENIGGQPRKGVAALDAATGEATDWTADINSVAVYTLALLGDTLFVGGEYTLIGGQRRHSLAALDVTTGAVLPWDPSLGAESYGSPNPVVWSLETEGSRLYVGGSFTRIGDIPGTSVAAFDFVPAAPPPGPTPPTLAMGPIWPNPTRTSATIRFALPRASAVNLAVFDVQGRLVDTLLDHALFPAGIHEIALRADGWPAGFYFCQVEAGGLKATRKLVVVK